jgi:hypothetical protein
MPPASEIMEVRNDAADYTADDPGIYDVFAIDFMMICARAYVHFAQHQACSRKRTEPQAFRRA